MELGACFDDDLFEGTRDKSQHAAPKSYNAKICTSQWFNEATAEDEGENMQLYKYRGDWAFRSQQYDKALESFCVVQKMLPASNLTMKREIVESMARCHLALGQTSDALTLALRLVSSSVNFDQKTASLQLLSTTYQMMSDQVGELRTLQKLAWMHPMAADIWIRMADIYDMHYHGNCHVSLADQQKRLSYLQHHNRIIEGIDIQNAAESDCIKSDVLLVYTKVPVNVLTVEPASGDLVTDVTKKLEGVSVECECLTMSTGAELQLVLVTCLLRTRLLTQIVGRVNPFVKQRYRKMQCKMMQRLEDLAVSDDVITKCLSVVGADVTGEGSRSSPPGGTTEADLLREVDMENFPQLFEKRWFSWR